MKVAAVSVAVLVTTLSARADACGVYDFGGMLAEVAKAFETKVTPVNTPLLEVGGGATTDGTMASIAVGYGWGEREDGFLFPGTTLSRVMLGVRSDGAESAVSATYGWYTNALGMLALDLGVESRSDRMSRTVGPTAKVLLGTSGVGVRLTGGAQVTDGVQFAGAAELVVEVMDLGKRL